MTAGRQTEDRQLEIEKKKAGEAEKEEGLHSHGHTSVIWSMQVKIWSDWCNQ